MTKFVQGAFLEIDSLVTRVLDSLLAKFADRFLTTRIPVLVLSATNAGELSPRTLILRDKFSNPLQ